MENLNKTLTECPKCHKPVKILKWNQQYNVVICNNDGCSKFRNPLQSLPKPLKKEEFEEIYVANTGH